MKIRTKTLIIVIISVICMVLLSQLALEYYVNNDIQKTESREAQELIARINANINTAEGSLNVTDYSWSNWDDTYYFVQDLNQQYIDNNFNESELGSYHLNFVIYLNQTGTDVFNLNYNMLNQTLEDFSPGTLDILTSDQLLLNHTNFIAHTGIVDLPSGPCLVSSWPILTSYSTGPCEGTLIMGYYLDSSQLLTLSKECGTLVSINILDSSLNPPQALASKNLQNDTDYYVIDSNESTAQIFSLIDDVHGQPSLILSTQLPRDAYQQGMSSLSTTFGFIVLIGLAMIVLCMILINNVVIARVSKLENDVKRIGKGDPNNDRLSPTGNDEIFSLSQEINGMIDNTEKRNQELRESEGRYKSIMEQSVCAIFIVNIEKDTILRTNQTFERIFGYSKEDIHQLKLSSLSSYPESRFEDFLKTISKDNPLVGKQIILKNKNGENLDVEISGSEIEYEGRRALSIIAWDVTEKHRLEREMARNQKLESLGVLAGGIAHDFNNMLTSIVSNIEIAKAQLPDNEMSKRRLEESVCSAMRAKHLTQQLLTFSKGGQPIKEILDLASIVRISTEFVLAGSKLVAEYDIEENLRKVFADPVQIDQVINNLIINAVQAMPRGGKLFIKVRNLVIEEGDYPLLESGHHIRIDIIDEGVGIPPNDLERIFDPFYTTKEKGSGLGLSTVRSIVSNHGGIVLVDSIVGKGTTFSVILPSIKTENLPAFYPSPEINNTTHHGRILVMDDEEPILDVLQTMLEDFGYQVACVRDGDEAISIYRTALSNGHPFQAVIMDLTIRGGMGGKEAVQGILALNPNARVIVSSGYSNDPIMANPQDYGFWDVLAKPFTMQDLSSKISSATANITNSLDLRETTKPIEDSGLE